MWLEAVNSGGQSDEGLRNVIFDDTGMRMWAIAFGYGTQGRQIDLVHLTRVFH